MADQRRYTVPRERVSLWWLTTTTGEATAQTRLPSPTEAAVAPEFAIALGVRRGQGLGTEATRLVLDFAFHVLALRNVLLETLEWNVAGLTAYERAGSRRVGVRRGAVMSRSRPTDVLIMDAVPEDFGASVLR
jgi:diamine N-acetyltransferase